MVHSTTYYTLIGSLPALPSNFEEAERVPISRQQLLARLRMLEPADAEAIDAMTDFLAWERQPLERTDEEVVRRYRHFIEVVDNPFAQDIIGYRMDVRSIIAALRCRRLQFAPPAAIEPIASRIARGWGHPDLRMGNQFPWIGDVDAQLNSSDPCDLERTILNISWRHSTRLAGQFQFSFESVLLYLIRWDIVYRWTQRNAAAGLEKFEQLATEVMGEYAEMYVDGQE